MKRLALFAALTALMTWPLAAHLASLAPPHQDVYFNMWRLAWFAHAVTTPGAAIFDANIFYPEARTLALSDAIVVESMFAAPLLWVGVRPVLVHNLTLLAGIALSGVAMFALAKHLTGSRGAALIAGMVFAFAPFRFEHIMHMEMQWAMWSPLAFLALHRLYETGRLRYGLAVGACLALQMLSSIYYGIFLATLIGVGGALWLPQDRAVTLRPVLSALLAGALVAAVLCGVYAVPYLRAHRAVGDRPADEISRFSAAPRDYLAASEGNRLYRASQWRAGMERHLFPGATPVLLAVIALLLHVPGRRSIVYLLLLVAAFEASLGPRGYSYPFLHDHVALYRGLRAGARLAIFVLLFLAVLAAYGYQALAEGRSRAFRVALLTACLAALVLEYRVDLRLAPFPNTVPPLYRLLATQPKGVVAEFPMPRADNLPGAEPGYAYMSTFHWFPLVNGYSGNYPRSYLARLDRLRDFPDRRSVEQLRRDGVRYVIVHQNGYPAPATLTQVLAGIEASGAFTELGSFPDADAQAWLFRVR
jgi:hypothetical protein